MRWPGLKPLVWPVALLAAGAVTALLAEATSLSVQTVTLYGIMKLVSDLVLATGAVWLVAAVVGSAARLFRPSQGRQ